MSICYQQYSCSQCTLIQEMLCELGIPMHRMGYGQLVVAIILFHQDDGQSVTKELYPNVAKMIGAKDWRRVERDTRAAIHFAWENRDQDVWDHYFPEQNKTPSNKLFIATLTQHLR